MIDLTPIAKNIQQKMFEKMRLLGRRDNSPNKIVNVGGLTHNKLAMRTPFIKMCSSLKDPVILMGGEVNEDGTIKAGYDQLYTGTSKRPIPGLKSIDVKFKGGLRALREATISWTIWSFEDLERLTPHFLSLGKTILLEWGWSYGKESLSRLPSFVNRTGIKDDIYSDYKNQILRGNGDFDAMIGIVTNFEYVSREDGAFDCTTTLISMGDSTITTAQPNNKALKSTIRTNVSSTDNKDEIKEKTDGELVQVLDFSTSLKTFIQNIDLYIISKIREEGVTQKQVGISKNYLYYKNNEWITQITSRTHPLSSKMTTEKLAERPIKSWVRWGWFEDNILSKFTTLVDTEGRIISYLRSVQPITDVDGTEASEYESVKIRNHPRLRTSNTSKYLLPGQFSFTKPGKPDSPTADGYKPNIKLEGDDEVLRGLASIVNENFKKFDAGNEVEVRTVTDFIKEIKTRVVEYTTKKKYLLFGPKVKKTKNEKYESTTRVDKEVEIPIVGERGYLRNMLVSTEAIKKAFGVSENVSFSESINVEQALDELFRIINEDIQFWSFTTQGSPTEPNRVAIIDEQITKKLPDKDIPIDSASSNLPTTRSTFIGGEVTKNGVFFFPTWRHDSFVKSQNISCTIPSSLAVTAMYGAGSNPIRTAGDTPPETVDDATNAQSSMDAGEPENKTPEVRIALYDERMRKIGADDDESPFNSKGSDDDIFNWFIKNEKFLKVSQEKKEEEVEKKTAFAEQSKYSTDVEKRISSRAAIPTLEDLLNTPGGSKAFQEIENFGENNVSMVTRGQGDRKIVESNFLSLYGQQFRKVEQDGLTFFQLKDEWMDSMSYDTMNRTRNKTIAVSDNQQPLVLPLGLELEIDGIGGIFPGNSFHSSYLPENYKKVSIFQIFDVNHKVDSSGWSVSLSGKMRSTLDRTVKMTTTQEELEKLEILERFKESKSRSNLKQLKEEVQVLLDQRNQEKFPDDASKARDILNTNGQLTPAQREYLEGISG